MKGNLAALLFSAVFALSALAAANCGAAEGITPSAAANVSLLSKYVWRGYELSDDSVVIQPSATVSYGGFSFSLWGNLDTDYKVGTAGSSQFNETDMTISYDTCLSGVNVGAGYIYYGLDGINDSQEVYVSAGLDTPLSPVLTVYREIAYTPAWYINLAISHSFALPAEMSLEIAGSAGYYISDDGDFAEANDPTKKYRAFHDGLISATLTVPVDSHITVSPTVAWSFPLSQKADDLVGATSFSGDSSFVFGGVTCTVEF